MSSTLQEEGSRSSVPGSDSKMASSSPGRGRSRMTARRARRGGLGRKPSDSASSDSSTSATATATAKAKATAAKAATTAAPDNAPTAAPAGRPSGPLNSASRTALPRRNLVSSPARSDSAAGTRPASSQSPSFLSLKPHTRFPSFRSCARFNGFTARTEPLQLFDCKFYPYTEPGVDPIFAFVGGAEVGIARPSLNNEEAFEIHSWLHETAYVSDDDDEDPVRASGKRPTQARTVSEAPEPIDLNSCVWLQDPETKTPLLAVTGKPSTIKVLDVLKRKAVRKFVGHGKEVNDLAVSPLNSSVFASASGDHTVRVWTLDPQYAKQPCMLLCAGEGHKQGLLTLAYHQTARYLLTGGVDNAVCLWVLPSLPNAQTGTDKPTTVHYPHFRSASIHTNFVDCVAFHHDLIISKCARENKIVIWRIEGFDSRREPPPKPPSVTEDLPTRSAWGGRFQRLTQLDVNDLSPFYMRFSLYNFPGERPILAIGNEKSRVYFWDLKSLDEWIRRSPDHGDNPQSFMPTNTRGQRGGRGRGRSRAFGNAAFRDASVASNSASGINPHSGRSLGLKPTDFTSHRSVAIRKYQMDDPFKTLGSHGDSVVDRVRFAVRQVAWSTGGEWLVAVGDQGMIGMFRRERPNETIANES